MKKAFAFLIGLAVLAIPLYLYIYRLANTTNTAVILGHGGMGVRCSYPLNSQGSIAKAFSFPIDGTELDVKVSADGVLFAFHDSELGTSTDCQGNVASTLSADIEDCEYNSWLHSEKVQPLRSILDSDYPEGTIFSLDLKPDGNVEGDFMIEYQMGLLEITRGYPQYKFLIESQSKELLTSLKIVGIQAKLFYYGHRESEATQIVALHGFDGISINMEHITAREISSAQSNGIEVMLWGCGSVFSNLKALEMNPDFIQTDAIPSMMTILNRK